MNTYRSEEIIKDFHRSLVLAGVSESSARRHRDKLRFFLHAYLAEEWPRDIDRVESDMIRDFLDSWFLRHVGGSKSDLDAYLDTFRRFFEHIHQSGNMTEKEYGDMVSLCANRGYFMARYDEYFHPMPDAWEDFSAGGPYRDGDLHLRKSYPGEIDRQLWMLVHNLERIKTPAVLDFTLFLDYLIGARVKLTPRHLRIPSRHIREINERFTRPEQLPARAGINHSRRLRWFYEMALELGMIRVGDDNLIEVMPGTETFLDLEADAQLAIIIDALWNRVSWPRLQSQDSVTVSEWAQEHRGGFASLTAELTPNREWALDPAPGMDRQDTLLARYIIFHEVVENMVLFALRECGIIEYTAWKTRSVTLKVKTITMTRFGRRVMRLFTRKASGKGKAHQSPLDPLQECLLLH